MMRYVKAELDGRGIGLSKLIALVVVVAAALSVVGAAAAQSFEFTLGFKTLADMIPTVAGQPLENEHYGANGDSLQQTTTGLMVWRKADNWTAFTDGSTTWLNGPLGLQTRPNNQRFDWERAASVDHTQVSVFRPAGIRGADQEGYCWTESLASGQADAWRCMVENRIYDPCFSIQGESGAVACGASPSGDPYAFRLRLTQPLPERKSPAIDRPWMIELADGVTCGFLTGATTGVGGERVNYGCTDGWSILGDPKPGDVWTANQVVITVASQGPTLVDSAAVNVKTVWK